MKKSILSAAVAAALSLSSAGVLAVVDIDAGTGAATYASEIDVEGVGQLAGAGLDADVKLGFGFANGNTDIYLRLDLTGGTWNTQLVSADMTMGGSTITLSNGGSVGSTSVIYNAVAVADLTADALLQFVGGSVGGKTIKIGAGSSNVSIRYRLYNTPADAVNGTASSLKDVSATYVDFAPGLTFTTTSNNSVATVDSVFTALEDNLAPQPTDPNTARIGSWQLGVDTNVLDHSGTGLLNPSKIVAASTVTVSGDFTAAGSVFRAANTNCTTGVTPGTVAGDGLSVEFAATNATTTFHVCYTGDGTKQFQESDYTITYNPVAQANYTASNINFADLALGKIDRDGSELQATFFTINPAAANRFIFINTGNADAPITSIRVVTNDGVTYTQGGDFGNLPIVIPAGTRKAVQVGNMVTGMSAGTAAAVIFSIGASDGNIQGTYQLVLPGSDVQTVTQMVRPGTN